jgi:hypothetical protein
MVSIIPDGDLAIAVAAEPMVFFNLVTGCPIFLSVCTTA